VESPPTAIYSLAPASDGAGGHEDEHGQDEDGQEGGDDGAAGALAEAVELHADGHPVGAPAAPVRHVHDGGRGGAGGREQAHHHHVAEEQEEPDSGGPGVDDAHGGEGQGQHQVPRRDGVAHHEEGEGREVVEPRVELEELREHGQALVGGARRDGGRQRRPEGRHPQQEVDHGQAATEPAGAGAQEERQATATTGGLAACCRRRITAGCTRRSGGVGRRRGSWGLAVVHVDHRGRLAHVSFFLESALANQSESLRALRCLLGWIARTP
jgi:hypothetical protein